MEERPRSNLLKAGDHGKGQSGKRKERRSNTNKGKYVCSHPLKLLLGTNITHFLIYFDSSGWRQLNFKGGRKTRDSSKLA